MTLTGQTIHDMALIIASSPHALANHRAIASDLMGVGFGSETIHRHLDAAVQKAASMRAAAGWKRRDGTHIRPRI